MQIFTMIELKDGLLVSTDIPLERVYKRVPVSEYTEYTPRLNLSAMLTENKSVDDAVLHGINHSLIRWSVNHVN